MLGAALALGIGAALLLRLAARLWRASARGAPERWLALCFAALGGGAVPRLLAARRLAEGDVGSLTLALNGVSHSAIELGVLALAIFVWRVFRPASRAARGLVGAVAASSGALTLWLVATTHVDQEASGLALALNLSRAIPVLWAFGECVRYAQLMRRRLGLGLAEPLVANRFLLWSVWTGALGVAALTIFAVRGLAFWLQLQGVDPRAALPLAVPFTGTVVGAAVACAGLAVWLAFFPPAAYRRWVAQTA